MSIGCQRGAPEIGDGIKNKNTFLTDQENTAWHKERYVLVSLRIKMPTQTIRADYNRLALIVQRFWARSQMHTAHA